MLKRVSIAAFFTAVALSGENVAAPGNEPADAATYNSKGYAYKSQGQYEKALYMFNESLKIGGDPSNMATAYHGMGDIYVLQGRYYKALEAHLLAGQYIEIVGVLLAVLTGSIYLVRRAVGLKRRAAETAPPSGQQ